MSTMTTTIDLTEVFNKAQSNLLNLAVGLRDREPQAMQRINAYVLNKTGTKFSEYLTGSTPVGDKLALVNEITAIINSGDLSKLPSAPNGQAFAPPAPRSAPPPASPKAEPPTPKVGAKETEPTPEVDRPDDMPEPPSEDTDELTDAIQTILKVATKRQPATPPAPSITEADVRRMVRAELADALEKIVKALRA